MLDRDGNEEMPGGRPSRLGASRPGSSRPRQSKPIKRYLGIPLKAYEDVTIHPYSVAIQEALVSYEQELTREVLAAHAAGFSTTSEDLIRDILPGI